MLVLFILFLLSFAQVYAKDLVLASSYPLYYPLKYLAEGRFEMNVLIKSQADPHHYELKPGDLRSLQRAKAFLYLGLEGWELKIAQRVPEIKSYPLGKGMELIRVGKGYDPHLWLSPKAYMGIVENIQKVLSQIDPDGSEYYKKRASEYMEQLKALDSEYKNALSTCKRRTLVITHLSTAYLGRDYGLETVGLRGVHAEEEPKPSEVRRMVERAKRSKVSVIFAEVGHDEKLAKRVAQEVGARVLPLNTSLFPEKEEDDYFSIMRRNLQRLSEGLECQGK